VYRDDDDDDDDADMCLPRLPNGAVMHQGKMLQAKMDP